MKINEFIKEVQENKTTVAISDLITTKKYISSAEKVRLAKDVLDFSVEYDSGFIRFDSYKKHLLFLFSAIETHTELHFADSWIDKMQEYDALCENELIDAIIDTFRKDYEASLEVLDMICGDMIASNSIEASMAKLAMSVSENLDVFVGTLADKLKNFNIEKIIPKDLDLNKLQKLLDKIK